MDAGGKARNAIIAACLGWLITWTITLLWFTGARLLSKDHSATSLGNELSGLAIYLVCTAAFTLLTTAVFIVPYVRFRSSKSILQRPWRMYLEPCLIGTACITVFWIREGPTVDSLKDKIFTPYLYFAMVNSFASSFFFLRRMRQARRQVQTRPTSEFDND